MSREKSTFTATSRIWDRSIRTTLSICVADALKLDLDHICVPDPDTNIVPFGLGCFASRGTYMATGAMHMAVEDMRAKLIKLASEMLSLVKEGIEAGGRLRRFRKIPLKSVICRAGVETCL